MNLMIFDLLRRAIVWVHYMIICPVDQSLKPSTTIFGIGPHRELSIAVS
jgi:hypothetical protein